MTSLECQRCGGPNPSGARNCQWCGSALPLPVAPPIPSGPNVDYVPHISFEAPARDEEFNSRRLPNAVRLGLAILFVVIFVVVAATAATSQSSTSISPITSPPSPEVNVVLVDVQSPDNACGLNGATEPGFSGSGTSFTVVWTIYGPVGGCTLSDIAALTTGVTAEVPGLPIQIASEVNQSVNVTFELPSGEYNGIIQVMVS